MIGKIFGFLEQAVGWGREWTNPENKRLRTAGDYQKELINVRKKRDDLLAKRPKNEKQKEEIAIELGLVAKRIVWLRAQRDRLAR